MLDRLKLSFILMLALLALTCPTLAGPQKSADNAVQAGPAIEVPERKYDAGTVPKDQIVFHEFLIRNQGPGELSILEVGTGCGCAKADYDRKISPGQEGRIGLTIEISEVDENGGFNQRAVVKTNAANLKLFMLEIIGTVQNPN